MQEQVTTFLEYLEVEQGYSQNTVSAYRNDLGQFLGYLQHLDPARRPRGWGNVTRDHIVGYMLEMKEREYASSTVARKVAAVKSFFNFLVEQGQLKKNPANELDSPKVERHLPAAIPPEEIDRLLAAPQGESPATYRDRALLESLYATGLRVSELVALDIADVDVDAGTVRCMGKGAKQRILPVYDRALQVIDDYINLGRPALVKNNLEEQALFLNRQHFNEISAEIKELFKIRINKNCNLTNKGI